MKLKHFCTADTCVINNGLRHQGLYSRQKGCRISNTGEFHRLGRCFVDWAIAAVGEGDTNQLYVSFTCHCSGPICETLAQSMELSGTCFFTSHLWHGQGMGIVSVGSVKKTFVSKPPKGPKLYKPPKPWIISNLRH